MTVLNNALPTWLKRVKQQAPNHIHRWFKFLPKGLLRGDADQARRKKWHAILNSASIDKWPQEIQSIMERTMQCVDKRVKDVMVSRTRMASLQEEDTLDNWVKEIVKTKHSRYPIMDAKRLKVTGVLLVKDLLPDIRDKSELDSTRVNQLKHEPYLVPESQHLHTFLSDLRCKGNHMAIVVDEHGDISGIATLEDALEAFIGEIEDEHDTDIDEMIVEERKDTWLVDALTPIDDFNRHFQTKVKHPNIETIGGWMAEQLQHVPKKDDTCKLPGYTITVTRAEKRRAQQLQITKKHKRSATQ